MYNITNMKFLTKKWYSWEILLQIVVRISHIIYVVANNLF
jgi:hypothetical protein